MLLRQSLILLVLTMTISSVCLAQTESSSPVGKTAPEWKNLPGIDDRPHSSEELRDAKAVLIVFLCNHCPCAKSYEERFKKFAEEYESRGVKLIAFNSDAMEDLDAMKERGKVSNFNFQYLRDSDQTVGKAFAAKSTPHVFLLDSNRKIVFSGAFDDDKSGKSVKKNYIVDAVEELLAGKPISVSESRLCGCSISYSK